MSAEKRIGPSAMKCCSSDELLAAYIDKMLPEKERIAFEHHLSICPECLASLVSTKTDLDEFENAAASAGRGAASPERAARDRRSPAPRMPFIGAFSRLRAARLSHGTLAAILCAGGMAAAFFAAVLSPAWDPSLVAGRANTSRILEATDIGPLRLAGGASAPVGQSPACRGPSGDAAASFEETERLIGAARARYPNEAEIYALLGDLCLAGGNVPRALIQYEYALTLRGNDPAYLNDLAVAKYRLGRSAEALSDLKLAAGTGRAPRETYYNLAVLEIDAGDRGAAESYAKTYLSQDPRSPWAAKLRELVAAR